MKKSLIWILVAALVLGGIFYAISSKGEKENQKNDSEITGEDGKSEDISGDIMKEPDDNDTSTDEPTTADEPTIELGKELPDFTLKNLKGEDVSLRDYKDKIVLVNFWATWCGFCDAEMPDLQKLHEENDDLVVLGVNVLEEKDVVEKYVKKGGYDFEVVLDDEGKVSQDYYVSGLPASYFTDKDGMFLGRVPGMLTYEQMNEILDNIRKEQKE